jgi:hypothetical protein
MFDTVNGHDCKWNIVAIAMVLAVCFGSSNLAYTVTYE